MNKKLYHHKTDGGAEYLCTAPIEGATEGDLHTAVVRLDGEPELISSVHAAAHDLLEALKNLYEHPVHMQNCAFLNSGVNTCDCAKGKAVAQAYEVLTKLGV